MGDSGSRRTGSFSAFCFGSGGLCTGGRLAGRLTGPEEEEEDGGGDALLGDGGGDGGIPLGGDLGGLGGADLGGFADATAAAVVGNPIRGADAAGPSPKSMSPTVSPRMSPSTSGRRPDAWFPRGDPAGVCIELDSDAESGTSDASSPSGSCLPLNSSDRRAFPFAGLDAASSRRRKVSGLRAAAGCSVRLFWFGDGR